MFNSQLFLKNSVSLLASMQTASVGSVRTLGTERHNIVHHDNLQPQDKERSRYNPALEEPKIGDDEASNEPTSLENGIFGNSSFVNHDSLHFFKDKATGLRAIVGVHDTLLGPALGGVRVYPYANESEAIFDVLRLSRGMTFKAACAGLPLGGGKAVIFGPLPEHPDGRSAVFRRFGMCIAELAGKYISAEDVGVQLCDMVHVKAMTDHVAGIPTEMGGSGNPAPYTAHGVFVGLKEAAKFRLEKTTLDGVRVHVEGCGSVGSRLIEKLVEENAEVYVSDINRKSLDEMKKKFGVKEVEHYDHRFEADVDIYSPCALGGTLNDDSLKKLKAKVIAGAANNQLLLAQKHSQALHDRGICYTPDYIANAGGLVNVSLELRPEGWNHDFSLEYLSEQIASNLRIIFQDSKDLNITTHAAAKKLAIRRLAKAAYDQGSHKNSW